ncbi:hypothetical protein MKX01_014769, partial [Papaver californicum]
KISWSSSNTPAFPPGFEPVQTELLDDASSNCHDAAEPQLIIPKKLQSEYKRHGITVKFVCNPTPKSRRFESTRGLYGLK